MLHISYRYFKDKPSHIYVSLFIDDKTPCFQMLCDWSFISWTYYWMGWMSTWISFRCHPCYYIECNHCTIYGEIIAIHASHLALFSFRYEVRGNEMILTLKFNFSLLRVWCWWVSPHIFELSNTKGPFSVSHGLSLKWVQYLPMCSRLKNRPCLRIVVKFTISIVFYIL